MTKELTAKDKNTEFLLYSSPNGEMRIEVLIHNENIWLTQDKMADLFGVQRPAITKHLINIFESGELEENSVSSILEHTASDEKKYKTKFYNLDAIFSVGYKVNSTKVACQNSKQNIRDHFADARKMVQLGSSSIQEEKDWA